MTDRPTITIDPDITDPAADTFRTLLQACGHTGGRIQKLSVPEGHFLCADCNRIVPDDHPCDHDHNIPTKVPPEECKHTIGRLRSLVEGEGRFLCPDCGHFVPDWHQGLR